MVYVMRNTIIDPVTGKDVLQDGFYSTRDYEEVRQWEKKFFNKEFSETENMEGQWFWRLSEEHFSKLLALGKGQIFIDPVTGWLLLGLNKGELKKIKAFRNKMLSNEMFMDIDRIGGPRALRKLQLENAKKQGLTDTPDYKKLNDLETEADELRKELADSDVVIDAPLDTNLEEQSASVEDLLEIINEG